MKSINAKLIETRNRENGLTLIESIVVVGILMIVAGMGIIQWRPMWQDQQANAGMDQVKTVLRQALETAISQRRSIVVKFVSTAVSTPCPPGGGIRNCIELFQMVLSGSPPTAVQAASPFLTMPIQGNVLFGTVSGEVDTPDGFGIPGSGGISFNGIVGGPPTGMLFQSNGTFTDGTGNPINGTVFLAVINTNNSLRAVTVLGNTGRIRSYKNNTSGWF